MVGKATRGGRPATWGVGTNKKKEREDKAVGKRNDEGARAVPCARRGKRSEGLPLEQVRTSERVDRLGTQGVPSRVETTRHRAGKRGGRGRGSRPLPWSLRAAALNRPLGPRRPERGTRAHEHATCPIALERDPVVKKKKTASTPARKKRRHPANAEVAAEIDVWVDASKEKESPSHRDATSRAGGAAGDSARATGGCGRNKRASSANAAGDEGRSRSGNGVAPGSWSEKSSDVEGVSEGK